MYCGLSLLNSCFLKYLSGNFYESLHLWHSYGTDVDWIYRCGCCAHYFEYFLFYFDYICFEHKPAGSVSLADFWLDH